MKKRRSIFVLCIIALLIACLYLGCASTGSGKSTWSLNVVGPGIKISEELFTTPQGTTMTAEALFERGNEYFNMGNYNMAITYYTEAINRKTLSELVLAEAYFNRSLAYISIRDYANAINDLTEAIDRNTYEPELAQAYYNRGVAHCINEDYISGIKDFTEAINHKYSNLAEAYYNRAKAYYENGDYDKAIADLKGVLKIDTNHPEAKMALELVRREWITTFIPTTANDFLERGNYYNDTGNFDNAIADFNAALRMQPNHVDALFGRGIAYFLKSDWDRAIADLEEVVRINPSYPDAKSTLETARRIRGY